MKKLFTFLAATFLVTALQAKIVYLNNSLTSPNISENLFTSWADAYAVISNGDTIYVSGTRNTYGRVTIDKKLTVIGPGYYLTQNKETQVNKLIAGFDQIVFVDGSQGSYIQGITDVEDYYSTYIAQDLENITIENCFLYTVFFETKSASNTAKISLKKNNIGRISMEDYYNGITTDIIISNNIIRGSFYLNTGSTGIIANNLLLDNFFGVGSSSSFEIYNNIYINVNENNFTIQPLPDASVHHNISLTGAFGDANGNITAPQSTLFIDGDDVPDSDAIYMLSENSPAKGAGNNGTDIGPFGGPDPYRLSGLPNLPNIYELSTGGFVSGDELPVTIKIKQ